MGKRSTWGARAYAAASSTGGGGDGGGDFEEEDPNSIPSGPLGFIEVENEIRVQGT